MIQSVSIIGMGALGLLYADQITTGLHDAEAVSFVMDPERAVRHRQDIYTVNGVRKNFRITDADEAEPADLVIAAVKYNELASALDTMKNCIGENTIILSVLNGVTSEKIIADRYGWDHIIYTVAQGMDAMRDGTTLKYTQCGALRIGITDEKQRKDLDAVVELFDRASVPHVVEEDILHRLWYKYMLNVGINQTCTAFHTTYGKATVPGTEAYTWMVGAMREVVSVAKTKGITLTEEDIQSCIDLEKTLDPDGYPSMEQDRRAGRRTELDMFAGEMLRMAEEIGIEAPCNAFFYDTIRKEEKEKGLV